MQAIKSNMLFLLIFITLLSCSEDEKPQAEPEEPEVFILELSPQTFNFEAEGTSENLQIETETDWEIQNERDWISFSEENGGKWRNHSGYCCHK